jgi:hypothetical protein
MLLTSAASEGIRDVGQQQGIVWVDFVTRLRAIVGR